MRVDFDPAAGAGADGREKEGGYVVLDAHDVDTNDPAQIAAVVTRVYGFVREGRTLIFAGDAPLLAAAIDAVGIPFIATRKATAGAIGDAPVAFACDGVDVDGAVAMSPFLPPGRPVRVAIAGLGLIGEGVAQRLALETSSYEICAALVREPFKNRSGPAVEQMTNDVAAFLTTRPDVVIDVLPCGKTGCSLIGAALDRGVSVVTANKQAIAGSMRDFQDRATETGAAFCYSASVGGGAPFVETVMRARRAGTIRALEAVLNGTVNFILTSLSEGERFDAAVRAAQVAGFAEPDPSADLSGADARAKIAILSYAAFGEEIPLAAIEVEALDARKAAAFAAMGGVWRQVARLERGADGRLTAAVRYERRDGDLLFEPARHEANALRITLADGRRIECRGKGAGRRPTVESILGDLASIRHERLSVRDRGAANVAALAVPA